MRVDRTTDPGPEPSALALTRRRLLFLSGVSVAVLAVPTGLLAARELGLELVLANYPRKRLARLSDVAVDRPVEFTYPFNHPLCTDFVYRLGVPAGGGIGPERDVVAFNSFCPHQGGPLAGRLNTTYQVLGPCPLHLSTFDLTRHGIVVSGHATEGLPQIVLELEGEHIYATGVMGLIYGFHRTQGRTRITGVTRTTVSDRR